MSLMEEQIVELFDICPERKQISSLAKMYSTTEDDIKEILQKHGREIPYAKRGPKPKAMIKRPKDAHPEAVHSGTEKEELKTEISNSKISVSEKTIPKIPDCVADTITKRINELETDIKNHQEMVRILEAEYTAHVNFLMSPFEQGNLSHNECSDDKIESPQP